MWELQIKQTLPLVRLLILLSVTLILMNGKPSPKCYPSPPPCDRPTPARRSRCGLLPDPCLCVLSFLFSHHHLELSTSTYGTLAWRWARRRGQGSDPLNRSTELGPLALGGGSYPTQTPGVNPQLPALTRGTHNTRHQGARMSVKKNNVSGSLSYGQDTLTDTEVD